MAKGKKVWEEADRVEARQMTADLRQPLTAVSNYIEAACIVLHSDHNSKVQALHNLEKARDQILRAGDILRRLRNHLNAGEFSF